MPQPRRLGDTVRFAAVGLMVISVIGLGCAKTSGKSKAESIQPAKVEKLPVETDLARITLTEDAERRLGITTVAVAERAVTRRRTFGGQATVPAGKSILVSTPIAGVVAQTDASGIPAPGSHVQAGQALLSLMPLLSVERDVPTPAEQVQLAGTRANLMAAKTVAAGDVERGLAEVEAAKIALDRAKQLFADRAGARRGVDDAEATLNIAQSTLDAAKERNAQLTKLLGMLDVSSSEEEPTPLSITTPIGGLVNQMNVSVGQTVAAGATLFEVVNFDTLWIRVPVFVDLLSAVRTNEPARLVSLSGDGLSAVTATPVAAPPTADVMSSSADLYYQVDNRELGLRPGQRVGVEVPMSATEQGLIVPVGAILYDIYGNTGVYAEPGARQYERRRVALRFVDGDDAVLQSGPLIGTRVVVDGAAELFGTEFGAGK